MMFWSRRHHEPIHQPAPIPPPVTSFTADDEPRYPRPLLVKDPAHIVHYWLIDYIENNDLGIWYLSHDITDDMREWCLDRHYKPLAKNLFLQLVAERKDCCRKKRPRILNEYEHGYAIMRLKQLGKSRLTQAPIYQFFKPKRRPETRPLQPERSHEKARGSLEARDTPKQRKKSIKKAA